MFNITSIMLRNTSAMLKCKNLGFTSWHLKSIKKLTDSATKKLAVNHILEQPRIRLGNLSLQLQRKISQAIPPHETNKISEDCKENGEQPTSGDETAEKKKTPEDEDIVCLAESVLKNNIINKSLIELILKRSRVSDISMLEKITLAEFICSAINDIKNNPEIYEDYKIGKLTHELPLGEQHYFTELFKQLKGRKKPDDKPPRKPLDENRKPKMIDPSAATIERLIEAKCYVDKTENVMNLLNDPGHKVFTRPRRFGKTLLLDTVELVCNCEKELFAECFIGDSKNGYEWKKYPVIKLNFSEIFKGPDLKLCQHLFIEQLQDIVRKENIDLKVDEYDDIQTFKNLVVTLNNKYHSQVVLLIDEYDHLLTNKTYEEINNMKDDKNENEFKFLKSFFNTTKYIHKDYLHLVLCTGVVKSSYNDIFSGGNNDTCLDYKTGYDTMIGFTETEIKNVFGFVIKEWVNSKPHLKLTQEIIMNELKINYNGYSFDAEAKQNIYNSWSITKSLYFKDFDAYWMESGSPTVLMNKISADPRAVLQLPNLSRAYSLSDLLSNYKATSDLNIMMFQLGYLTLIKQQTNESNVTSLENVYSINYPNQEVKKAFTRLLLKHMYSQNVLDEIELNKKLIVQELKKQNSVPLIEFINKHLPKALSNSASEKRKDGELYEKTYNSYIYAIIQGLLGNCELQQSINGKKLDLIIKLGEAAFVIEMKVLDNDKKFKKESYEERKKRLMESAYDALEQIEDNKYYEEHKSNDKLQVIGMIFSNNKIAAIKYGNKISYVKNKLHFDDFRDFFFEDEVMYGNMNIKKKRFIK